jgi:DNA-binding transcriptional regulator YiaG
MTPDQFKATRKELGITQSELAEEWGVHVQSISKWERGVDPINPIAAYALRAMSARVRLLWAANKSLTT